MQWKKFFPQILLAIVAVPVLLLVYIVIHLNNFLYKTKRDESEAMGAFVCRQKCRELNEWERTKTNFERVWPDFMHGSAHYSGLLCCRLLELMSCTSFCILKWPDDVRRNNLNFSGVTTTLTNSLRFEVKLPVIFFYFEVRTLRGYLGNFRRNQIFEI